MKTIYFTNNDLAKAMGLEVGKKYVGHFPKLSDEEWSCVYCDDDIGLQDYNGYVYGMKSFIGVELTEIKPKPKLTEQEITILKGRLAEGFTHILRQWGSNLIRFKNSTWNIPTTDNVSTLFVFIKNSEEYSIEELLKGVE